MSNQHHVFVIHRTTGKFLVADDVTVHESRVMEYETPSGKEGYLQPDAWVQAQEKPLSSVQDMYADDALSTDGEREFGVVKDEQG